MKNIDRNSPKPRKGNPVRMGFKKALSPGIKTNQLLVSGVALMAYGREGNAHLPLFGETEYKIDYGEKPVWREMIINVKPVVTKRNCTCII